MHYVGRARREQDAGRVHAAAGLFPEGTEFLHSVRYLDIAGDGRSEEHTSELQSLMRISYAVFCLTKKKSAQNVQTAKPQYIPSRMIISTTHESNIHTTIY